MAGNSGEAGRSVLSRAIAILDSFSQGHPEQTLGSIVSRTGLAPATVHRLLAELVEWGGLERAGRGRYRVGLRLWQLGALAPAGRRLRDVALPYLEDLYEATHQVVHLAVLDAGEVLYIEKLSARPETDVVSVVSKVGIRLPAHATGPGKVLLAFSPADVTEQVIAAGLSRCTPRTITDPQELRSALADVRRTGRATARAAAAARPRGWRPLGRAGHRQPHVAAQPPRDARERVRGAGPARAAGIPGAGRRPRRSAGVRRLRHGRVVRSSRSAPSAPEQTTPS